MATTIKSRFARYGILLFPLLLTACGGGGGGSSDGDTVSPSVTALYPADNTTGVVTTTELSVQFDEPIDSATLSGNFLLVTTIGGVSISGTISYDSASYTAYFTPDTPLDNGIDYSAYIGSSVADLSGNALSASQQWSFTTVDAAAEWQQLGLQVSPATAESEDPTMLVTGTTPSVGYRHASFELNLNTWNGADWGTSKVHPESGNIESSPYSTPSFASDGSSIFVAYSLSGGTYATDEGFYNRIFIDQCTTGTAWGLWSNGDELSTPYNATYGGADAWEPAVAVASGFDPVIAWTEADVIPDPDTEDGAWVASASAASSVRSDILSRDNREDPSYYYTDVRTVGITMDNSGNTYLAQWESDAVDQDRTNLYVAKYSGGAFTSLGGSISADYDYNNLSVPSMEVIGSDLYITYTEANAVDYTRHVYVKKFDGSNWTTVGGGPVSAFSSSDHYDSGNPDLAVVNGTLYLAWEESDQYDGPFIFVARWDDTASQWVLDGDMLNVDTARTAHDPSLAYSSSDSTLYLAFEEYVSGWPQIFVKYKQLAP